MASAQKGLLGHLKHYVEPDFILLPIEIASELARTLSLTFRLFGNILGEEIVIAVLFLILPVFIPVPMMLFSIFTSVIQAYVFAMLTVVYLAGAVQAQHKCILSAELVEMPGRAALHECICRRRNGLGKFSVG